MSVSLRHMLTNMLRRLGRTFARFVGLIFIILGVWVFAINLIELSYSGSTLAWIVVAGVLGATGGVAYLLSFDGPRRLRTRSIRLAGWTGMLVLALLPSSLSFILLAMILLSIPTMLSRPNEGESEATSAA